MGRKMANDIYLEKDSQDCAASDPGEIRDVALEDCDRISRIIRKAGISGGYVGYDNTTGQLKLRGSYANEDEVDLAFMVAFTLVGANSLAVSPVTPRDVEQFKLSKTDTITAFNPGTGRKYALLIGVSKFKLGIKPIETAVNDVNAMRSTLIANGFHTENIVVLTDESATRDGIINSLRQLQSTVAANDSLILFISTHGTSPNTFGKMGIVPFDLASEIKSENMDKEVDKIGKDESGDSRIIEIAKQRLAALKTAVSYDDLQEFISGLQTNRFVAVLDTCYSGAALGALSYPVGGSVYAQRELVFIQNQSAENRAELLGSGKICTESTYEPQAFDFAATTPYPATSFPASTSAKGMSLNVGNVENDNSAQTVYSQPGYFDYDTLEKFRKTFGLSATVPQYGKAIVTATSGQQKSLFDLKKLPNSFFTYYFAKGLKKSQGELFQAFDYARIRTEKIVHGIGHEQTPEMISIPDACININLAK